MSSILVVDDDPHLREVLRYALTRQGFTVREASNGVEALAKVAEERPNLVVLDVLMPEMDGLETCRRLRMQGHLPIVFLSSRDEEVDRVLGLEMGGDDYLTKPFSTRELVARVRAVLRRTQVRPEPAQEPVLQVGTLKLDADSHRVWVGETEITLTVTEFAILGALMARPGRAWTRDALSRKAYGEGHHVSDRTLDSHIRRVRRKLRDHGLDPIETVHGLGYRLRAD